MRRVPGRYLVDGAFDGSRRQPLHGPGAELLPPFGVDRSITVERIRLPESKRSKGLRGKVQLRSFSFETRLENHRSEKIVVSVEESSPVSEDARIEVSLNDDTTSGWQRLEKRPGIIKWPITLEPGERRVIRFSYTVRFPSDLTVAGLP